MATKIIRLSKGKTALVDEKDYALLKTHKWHFSSGYAQTSVVVGVIDGAKARRTVKMHRLIMNAKEREEVDHINGNRLDNTRSNLRICTHKENSQNKHANSRNTTGFKGVFFKKRTPNNHKCWYASIGVNGDKKYLGYFYSAEEAAIAYNQAAIKYFGEFAQTNGVEV